MRRDAIITRRKSMRDSSVAFPSLCSGLWLTSQNDSERRARSDKEDMRVTNRMDRYRVRCDELVV